jgi:hypothetical protein
MLSTEPSRRATNSERPPNREQMDNLILPVRVAIQLVDKNESPIRIPNVLFRITAFAPRKNDFHLQPFGSDDDGLVTITRKELEAGVADCYDEGLMDYAHIGECSPSVEIRLITDQELINAVEGRKIWRILLKGERSRWNSLEQLLAFYKNANNRELLVDHSRPMRAIWNTEVAEHSYKFVVVPKVLPSHFVPANS